MAVWNNVYEFYVTGRCVLSSGWTSAMAELPDQTFQVVLEHQQLLADPALLEMLFATIEAVQASLAAQQRSIEEVRQNWRI